MSDNIYRCHDYRFLIQRWRKICRLNGLNISKIVEVNNYPCFEIYSKNIGIKNTIYLSAGIHGDEPGATEGLLAWAESYLHQFRSHSFLIYPCLNPWGLENNSRFDANGFDLNRLWNQPQNRLIQKVLERTQELNLSLVVNVHEDFEGQGVYLYEPYKAGLSYKRANQIIRSATSWIRSDPRPKIDGRKSINGVIRPNPSNPPPDGIPEALYFHFAHNCSAFTLETPSEFGLNLRIKSQVCMIQESVKTTI